jgi:hypothetical protein
LLSNSRSRSLADDTPPPRPRTTRSSSLLASPFLKTTHSAVAPRRGSLVVVASGKKTDVNKQGLNSIKVRMRKEENCPRAFVVVVVVENEREPKLSSTSTFVLTLLSPFLSLFPSSFQKTPGRRRQGQPDGHLP